MFDDILKENTLELKEEFLANNILLSYMQPYTTNIKSFVFNDKLSYKDYEQYIIEYEIVNEVDSLGLSKIIYGTEDYWWIILYINNIVNPYLFNINSSVANNIIKYLSDNYSNISIDNKLWHDMVFDYISRHKKIKIVNPSNIRNFITLITEKNK